MAAMDAIENADGQEQRAGQPRELGDRMEDLHQNNDE